jgi:hypothetical protein
VSIWHRGRFQPQIDRCAAVPEPIGSAPVPVLILEPYGASTDLRLPGLHRGLSRVFLAGASWLRLDAGGVGVSVK